MAKAKNKHKKKAVGPDREIRNARARFDYILTDKLEVGIMLTGTEIKAVREGKMQLEGAFVRVRQNALWLQGARIEEYSFGSLANHPPLRERKLLAHAREVRKFAAAVEAGGFTIVPTRAYFKKALLKVEVALAKGKKLHDKREADKRKTANREADRAMKAHR